MKNEKKWRVAEEPNQFPNRPPVYGIYEPAGNGERLVMGGIDERDLERAHLIAAAPDLLALLEEMAGAKNASTRKVWRGMSAKWRAEVRTAIKKAKPT